MEGKKHIKSSSTFDELKEAVRSSPAAAKSSSSAGYFSNVFPPASTVMGKDSSQSDLYLYRTLDKQKHEGVAADGKYQGSLSKNQSACKDGKPISSTESIESPYFGSSVHYGGRDFYPSSSSQTSETPNAYKNREEDDFGDPNAATRGDWWQGSLYY